MTLPRRINPLLLIALILACATPSPARQTTNAPPPAPPAADDVRSIRMKISAGDLPSAESILEGHRAEKGEDSDYLLGVAWIARGAALTGDWKAAASYAASARALADSKLKSPVDYETNREAVYALGTAIEVQAQVLVAAGHKKEAIRFLAESSQAQAKAPYNLRARIWKRRNQIELAGQRAPEIQAEDHAGAEFASLEALRGKPLVLFFWWQSCGDCKAEAPVIRRLVEKYGPKGVNFVAPTRFYTADHNEEKQKIEKAWKEIYALPGFVSAPISDEAMVRYGVSATPTFAFINRKGIVVHYSPTRMTEARMSAAIEEMLR